MRLLLVLLSASGESHANIISESQCLGAGLPLFTESPRRVLLGNPASGVPIPGNKGMKLRLSEVAEFARLEPLQYQLEGTRVNVGSTRERIIHSPDRE